MLYHVCVQQIRGITKISGKTYTNPAILNPGGINVADAATFVGTIIIHGIDGSNHYDVKGNFRRSVNNGAIVANNITFSPIGAIDAATRQITDVSITNPSTGYFKFNVTVGDSVTNSADNPTHTVSLHIRVHESNYIAAM